MTSDDRSILAEIKRMTYAIDGSTPMDPEVVMRLVLVALLDFDHRMQAVEKQTPYVKMILSVASVLGLSLIGLLWALITGRADIIFV